MKFSKITFGLAIFIIISASFMRAVLNFLYRNLGRNNLQILVTTFFVLIGIIIIYQRRKFIFNLKSLLILVLFTAGFIYAWQIRIIEERIHLLEYGLLGWLATTDVSKVFKSSKVKKFISYPLLFVIGVGILDELFQWWLPTRVGDMRDVVFNTLGGFWGITLKILDLKR